MGMLLIVIGLTVGALWDVFTTFYGVTSYFDLPMDPDVNPAQFAFAAAVTAVVFGFVIATHLIWKLEHKDVPSLLLRAAWAACVAIDLVTSWEGTRRFVFYGEDGDAARGMGLAVASALIVSSTIFLSRLILSKEIHSKPYLN